MARQLKPYKVDTVCDGNSGQRVDIFLDRNRQTFFGQIGPDRFEADTCTGAIALVREAMSNWRPVEWRQVIAIDCEDSDYASHRSRDLDYGCAIRFGFSRYETSTSATGKPISRPFLQRGSEFGEDKPGDWEIERREDGSDWQHDYRHADVVIPYDDQTWLALNEIKRMTDLLADRLRALLGPDVAKLKKMIGPKAIRGLIEPAKSRRRTTRAV